MAENIENEVLLERLYPELFPEQRKERARIDHLFFSGNLETLFSYVGPPIDAPERAIMIGVDDVCAVALKGPADVVAEFLAAKADFEREQFLANTRQRIESLTTSQQADRVMEECMAIAVTDEWLKPAVKEAAPLLAEKRAQLEASNAPQTPTPITIRDRQYHPGVHSCIEVDIQSVDPSATKDDKEDVYFRVWTCSVPKNDKGKRGWKDRGAVVYCQRGTVPCAGFNAGGRLAIAYQPVLKIPGDYCHLDIYENYVFTRPTHRLRVPVPRINLVDGFMTCSVTKRGNVLVTYPFGVIFLRFDRYANQIRGFLHSIVHDTRKGVVTCASVFEEANVLTIGTVHGEIYIIDPVVGVFLNITRTPSVEAVLSIEYNNKSLYIHTVMGCCGTFALEQHVALMLDRPLCVVARGTVIAMLNKYGIVQIMSSIARTMSRSFSSITLSERANTLLVYPAIHMGEKSIVVVYPDGQVRKITQ